MLISDLPKLKAKVDADLTINENNVSKKSLDSAYIYHQFLDLHITEIRELKRLAVERDRIYGTLYEKFKFNGPYKLDSKGEIEAWIHMDPQYIKTITEFNEQEVICKYLEGVVEVISKMSFNIKNFIEYKKFLSGG